MTIKQFLALGISLILVFGVFSALHLSAQTHKAAQHQELLAKMHAQS